MKNDIEIRHIFDLAKRSYQNNQYTFTDFLTPAVLGDFFESIAELPPCGYDISGGYENAERVMIRFGKEEDLGYIEDFPITCISIRPVAEKFADQLSHRDVLGAIMNIGMEREKLGDIMIRDNRIWVLSTPGLAAIIIRELTRIKHTSVICSIEEAVKEALKPQFEELKIQASSERIDGIVAKLCKLSRNEAAKLFVESKVAVNGRITSNHSYLLKENDVISVRGYGKFRYLKISGVTRKGNNLISIEKYI